MRKAKFNFSPILVSSIIAIVVAVLLLTFSQDILGSVKADQVTGAAGCNSTTKTTCGYDYNSTLHGQGALDNVAKKTPTLGTIIIAVVLITVLIGGFAMFGGRQ